MRPLLTQVRGTRLAFTGVTLGAACLLALGNGCFVETETPRQTTDVQPTVPPAPQPPVQLGKLVVRFTISGATDPNECAKADVKDLELTLSNADANPATSAGGTTSGGGRQQTVWRQPCEAFAMSLSLNPGSYSGSAVLLDALHAPRTTRVPIDRFTVRSNESVEVTVNFPTPSFLK